ncbi:MAG: permease prefix domain 1-containing protein [Planctomycetota bacterium]|nr:permease prefix domain 1-containing protein [Planctomycetota bacterium]
MTEPEFEELLRVVTQRLRLKEKERRELLDELRDHYEARKDALLAEGLSPEDAVRIALSDFGDAVELSGNFNQVTRLQHRRFLMRITTGTTIAAAALLLAVAAFFPNTTPAPLTGIAQAQSQQESAAPGASNSSAVDVTAEVEARLEQPIAVQFENVPLRDAVEFVSAAISVDILFSRSVLGSGDVDEPISLQLKHREIPARAALDWILAERNMSYTVRDGIIRIGGEDESLEIAVYPVRDLELWLPAKRADRVVAEPSAGMMGMPGTGGTAKPAKVDHEPDRYVARNLAELLTRSVAEQSWMDAGGAGTVMEYNGLLVVNQQPKVHAQIRKLLQMLRAAQAAENAAIAVGVPSA